MRHHWSCRSPAASSLWRTDTVAPKRARAARTSIGVSPISGTRTMAPRPRARASSTARKYTSVFPLPVTPYSRKGRNAPSATAARRGSSAVSWSGVGEHGRRVAVREPRRLPHVPLVDEDERPLRGEAVDRPAQGGPVAREVGHAGAPPGRAQALEHLGLRPPLRLERRVPQDGDARLPEPRGSDLLVHRDDAGAAQPGHAGLRILPEPLLERGEPQRTAPRSRTTGSSALSPGFTRRTTARLARTPAGGRTIR